MIIAKNKHKMENFVLSFVLMLLEEEYNFNCFYHL